MTKVYRIDCYSPPGQLYGYKFKCPGCGNVHVLPVGPGNGEAYARWQFNGDVDSPTFSPSVLAKGITGVFDSDAEWTGEFVLDADKIPIPYVCHSFITDGRIQFLGDCTHSLAGQTVDLPDVQEATHD